MSGPRQDPIDAAVLVDAERLTEWLDDNGLEPGEPLLLNQMRGGSANVLYSIERGKSRWVLRRPTRIANDRANEGMRREFRILSALSATAVPHPAAIALCADHNVVGSTFFLMEHVDGVSPIPVPTTFPDNESSRLDIAFAMVDALATLHTVDLVATGLSDIGHPEGFHERQVSRWSKQLHSYEGRALPGFNRVAAWLNQHLPASFEPTMMHGDFHMANALIGNSLPAQVLAILDWETATVGDPLLDLVAFCEPWCDHATEDAGWPPRDKLLDRYRSQRPTSHFADLTYYQVLYHFRLAILMEGSYQHSVKDPTRPSMDDIGDRVLASMQRALTFVEANR